MSFAGATSAFPQTSGHRLRNSSFIGNTIPTSTGGGAGINVGGQELGVTIEGCYFEDNVTNGGGGAISIGSLNLPAYVIRDCVFWKNRCTTPGSIGGAIFSGGSGSVLNCTFHENEALSGLGGSTIIFSLGAVTFTNNVVSSSSPVAAVRSSGATMTVGCNVYWQNVGGNTIGFTMSPTSRDVNPYYCDAAGGDFSVAADSPCLPPNSVGCGQIGAREAGCGPVSLETMSWGAVKGAYR